MASQSNNGARRDWRRMTRTIAHYERIEQIGEGTYGQVYKAKCLDTGRIVALKKIRVHHGGYFGLPPTVIREIKILKRLVHPSLVSMLEVVSSKGVEYLEEHDEAPERKSSKNSNDRIDDKRESYKGNIYLVLDYISHDLTGLMDVAYRFTEQQVKCIFRQLLEALQYMHDQKYIHRDIKSSNILIDSNFRVKLADFGLSRCIEPPILENIHDRGTIHEFTNKVITLWYRPPEILLGATRYGAAVDMWSAGCILAELMLGRPLFTGKTEMEQLQQIFDLLGTPTADSWEGFTDLKLMKTGQVTIDKQKRPKLREKYGHKMPTAAMNLIEKLLELDPNKRLTASRALTSRYFLVEPRAPERPEDLGTLQLGTGGGHFHEFQTKKKRREAKALAKKASNEARSRGLTEKEAEAEFDAVYRECMKKVAEEGNKALITEVERREMERRDKEKIDEDLGIDAIEEEIATKKNRADKREAKKERSSDRRDSKGERGDRKRHRGDGDDRDSRREEDPRKKRRPPEDEPEKRAKNDSKPDERERARAPVIPDSSVPPEDGSKVASSQEQRSEVVAGFSPDPNEESRRKDEKPSRKRTSSKEGGSPRHSNSRENRGRDDRHRKSSRRDRDRDSSSHRKSRDRDNERRDRDSENREKDRHRRDKDHDDRRDKGRDRHDDSHERRKRYSPGRKKDDRKRRSEDDRYGPSPDDRRSRRDRDGSGGRHSHDDKRTGNRKHRTEDDYYGPPPDERHGRRERDRMGGPDTRDRNREAWNGPPPPRGPWRDGPPPDRRGGPMGPPPGRRVGDGGRNSPGRGGSFGTPRRGPPMGPRARPSPPQQQGNPYGPPPGGYQQGPPPGARGLPPGYRGGGDRNRRREPGDRRDMDRNSNRRR